MWFWHLQKSMPPQPEVSPQNPTLLIVSALCRLNQDIFLPGLFASTLMDIMSRACSYAALVLELPCRLDEIYSCKPVSHDGWQGNVMVLGVELPP
jgi:hypothetical protein